MQLFFFLGKQNVRNDLDYTITGGIIVLKSVVKHGLGVWIGFMWLTVEYSGKSLVNTMVHLDFHKICELSRPSEHLLACK